MNDKLVRYEIFLSEQGAWLLFNTFNTSAIVPALEIGYKRLADEQSNDGVRPLYGNDGLHVEVMNGLINMAEITDK